ncbi:MAG: DUF423 domain-containing protein [Xanthobacteraceae bacterium]
MISALLVTLAGLMGAGGVALAAASAHAVPNAGLDSAGHMLLFHAAALLGATVLLQAGLVWRPLGLVAAFGLALGATLFAGDITLRAFAGHRLFPMAAPTGGMILMASWLVLAAAGIVASVRG